MVKSLIGRIARALLNMDVRLVSRRIVAVAATSTAASFLLLALMDSLPDSELFVLRITLGCIFAAGAAVCVLGMLITMFTELWGD